MNELTVDGILSVMGPYNQTTAFITPINTKCRSVRVPNKILHLSRSIFRRWATERQSVSFRRWWFLSYKFYSLQFKCHQHNNANFFFTVKYHFCSLFFVIFFLYSFLSTLQGHYIIPYYLLYYLLMKLLRYIRRKNKCKTPRKNCGNLCVFCLVS